ncbi:CHC2 zinc finger domain-containing protein [Lunatibacter salilacus]|uniref:CHC2 zinc finger domain-containing protein n=1 Tax=Lunatibacter salilacus TaxID=2483804 RepID=UPI00131CCC80|nr:CHC2 zinc finger domain-containing protein [Lunatibacter salilacus]
MEIQQIKEQLTWAEVIKHYGLIADKQARLKCPFHNDRTPSLQLYYKTRTAFCFSTNCQTHGKAIDVIDFILYYEKCTKHEAIKKAESIVNPGAATTQTTATTLRQAQGSTNEKAMFLERMFTISKMRCTTPNLQGNTSRAATLTINNSKSVTMPGRSTTGQGKMKA